jgi:uncharacterized glyoxalase superfamily protein PhnB
MEIMRQSLSAAASCALLILCGATAARAASLENVPLKWAPTSTLGEMGAIDLTGAVGTTKIRVDALVDTRQNPTLVAENREKVDKVRQMTTSSDVAAFVTEHLKDTLRHAGLNIVDEGADVVMSGEIRQFFVTEVNTYGGELSILVHLKNTAGKELWTGVVAGDSTRWGRSYSAENYYETMSDMLLRGAFNLLSNPGFREALGKR